MSDDSSTSSSSVSPLASEWPKLERALRLSDKWHTEVKNIVAKMNMKRESTKEKKTRKKTKGKNAKTKTHKIGTKDDDIDAESDIKGVEKKPDGRDHGGSGGCGGGGEASSVTSSVVVAT